MTSRPRQLLAAAVLGIAAVGVGGLTTAPAATAATCGSSSGVSVVVDFGALGGGVQTACMSGGGGQPASSLLTGAGFDLSYVQNQPGFVCRINQRPSPADQACVNTPPDNAYWGLWWSDGTSGNWTYSNYGVGTLKVPDGGYVGFAWQTGSQNPPNISPQPHVNAPSPTPSVTPTSGGGGGGGGHGNGGGGHGSASPTVKPSTKPSSNTSSKPPTTSTAAPTTTPTASNSLAPASASPDETNDPASPTATPTLAPSDRALPSASDPTSAAATSSDSVSTVAADSPDASSDDTAGALPAWAVPLVLLALAAGGGATYLLRRRHRTSP